MFENIVEVPFFRLAFIAVLLICALKGVSRASAAIDAVVNDITHSTTRFERVQ